MELNTFICPMWLLVPLAMYRLTLASNWLVTSGCSSLSSPNGCFLVKFTFIQVSKRFSYWTASKSIFIRKFNTHQHSPYTFNILIVMLSEQILQKKNVSKRLTTKVVWLKWYPTHRKRMQTFTISLPEYWKCEYTLYLHGNPTQKNGRVHKHIQMR